MGFKKAFFSLKPMYLLLANFNKMKVYLSQRRWEKGMQVKISPESSISIGKNNNFRRNLQLRAVYQGKIEIGDNCFFNTNVSITSLCSIKIGDNVKIANNVVIVDHDHDFQNGLVGYKSGPITIENDVWIGANAVILKGVNIGSNSVVAAGSVVRNDVPSHCIVAGVPAEIVKKYE